MTTLPQGATLTKLSAPEGASRSRVIVVVGATLVLLKSAGQLLSNARASVQTLGAVHRFAVEARLSITALLFDACMHKSQLSSEQKHQPQSVQRLTRKQDAVSVMVHYLMQADRRTARVLSG
jgi:hypothetical protein